MLVTFLRLAFAVLLAALPLGPATAQDNPEHRPIVPGHYANETCGDYSAGGFWYVGRQFDFFAGDIVWFNAFDPTPADHGWWRVGEGSDLYFLQMERDTGNIIYGYPPETNDTTMPPLDGIDEDAYGITRYVPCDSMPIELSITYGEALAVMIALEDTITRCASIAMFCARDVFLNFDLSGDGELSRAELSRAMRAALVLAFADGEEESPQMSTGSAYSSLIAAPALAQLLLLNFDYDMSGALTTAELLSSRVPDDWLTDPLRARSQFQDFVRGMITNSEPLMTWLRK